MFLTDSNPDSICFFQFHYCRRDDLELFLVVGVIGWIKCVDEAEKFSIAINVLGLL